MTKSWEKPVMVGLILLTFALCVVRFDAVPPGVIHDEVLNRLNIALIQQGDLRALYPFGGGREALFLFLQTASVTALGDNLLAMRLPSIYFAVFGVVGVYVLTRRLFGSGAALFAAASLATSFWALIFARLGTRESALPTMALFTAYAFVRLLHAERPPVWGYALSGGLLGLTLYTYPAGLIFPVVIGVWLGWLALTRREWVQGKWLGLAGSFLLAGVIAVPLALNWVQPEATARADAITGPLNALQAGDPGPLLGNVLPVLGMFTVQGDVGSEFNNPDQPAIPTLPMAVLFYIGTAVAVTGLFNANDDQRPGYALTLLWLVGLLIPTMVTERPVAPYRTIGVLGIVYVIPAALIGWVRRLDLPRVVIGGVAVLVLFVHGGHTLRAYLVTWSNNPVVYFLYQGDYRVLADDLDRWEVWKPPSVGGLTPAEMDRTSLLLLMADDDRARSLSFFDPQTALLTTGEGVIIPGFVTPHALFEPFLTVEETHAAYTVYSVSGPTLGNAEGDWQIVTLNGMRQAAEGVLVTQWQVHGPSAEPLRIFLHVTDTEGAILSQSDVLGVPAEYWRPGEMFYQVHEVTIPAEATHVNIGLYNPETGVRLPAADRDFVRIPLPE